MPRETPQSISVVTRQEMDDFNLASINKVMEHTPGLNIVTYDSERTEYYARGFAIQNFQYDGIPMLGSSAYSAGHTLSDMAIYDRVEVLKGSTGLLTGTGDPGAAINLIRKKPTNELQGLAKLSAGSWDNYRTDLDFSGALNENGSVRGRAVAAYQDMHSHLDRYQRQTSVFYGILEADLSSQTLLTAGANYQDSDPEGNTWGGIHLFDSNGNFNARPRSFNNGASWNSWKQNARTAFATLEHEFDNEWVMKLQLNHQVNAVWVHSQRFLEGRNKEIGLKSSFFDGRLNASAAYFQLDQNNYPEVVPGGRTPSGDTAYRATQGVKTRGYELEASGQLAPNWQVHAGLSHKISRQRGKKVATLTPENMLTFYTSYKPARALGGLTLSGGIRWQDKIWGAVTNLQDRTGPQINAVAKSFWLLDSSTRYQFNENLSASLGINNLLDKKYYTIFNCTAPTHGASHATPT